MIAAASFSHVAWGQLVASLIVIMVKTCTAAHLMASAVANYKS
jgi:hypothetical protein